MRWLDSFSAFRWLGYLPHNTVHTDSTRTGRRRVMPQKVVRYWIHISQCGDGQVKMATEFAGGAISRSESPSGLSSHHYPVNTVSKRTDKIRGRSQTANSGGAGAAPAAQERRNENGGRPRYGYSSARGRGSSRKVTTTITNTAITP